MNNSQHELKKFCIFILLGLGLGFLTVTATVSARFVYGPHSYEVPFGGDHALTFIFLIGIYAFLFSFLTAVVSYALTPSVRAGGVIAGWFWWLLIVTPLNCAPLGWDNPPPPPVMW